MSVRQIHVFISHAWAHSDHYNTLARWIFDEKWSVGSASLDFRNYSVPKDDPIHDAANTSELKKAIYNQIGRSHVVVIPTGMYATHSKWIKWEIEAAKELGKPIVAIDPWGQQRISDVVSSSATEHVGWNKEPMVDAIWRVYYAINQ